MYVFHMVTILATLLCSLVAGFLFAFAVVVMPGINRLEDRAFIRAFQVMDGIIQDNQPLFMLMWGGSVLALIAAAVLGIMQLEGFELAIIILAALTYLLGVQLPTGAVNIPLNNQLQSLDLERLDKAKLQTERHNFEQRWNRWNAIRTVLAVLTSLLLLILLYST